MPGPFDTLRSRLARIWHNHPGRWSRALSASGGHGAADHAGALDWPRFLSWRGAAKFVACWLIAMCFPIIDPFEAEHSTRTFARDLYNLLMGTEFPSSITMPRAEGAGRELSTDDVTVVLVDEKTLQKITLDGDRIWPPTGNLYGQMLDAILAYHPKAVFMDILFMDPVLGSFEPFSDAMEHYEEARTPLLLVGRTASDTEDPAALESQDVPEDFARALTERSEAASGDVWAAERKLDMVEPVLAPITRKNVVVRSYQLGDPPGRQDGQRSVAARLYEIATGRPFDLSGPRMELFWDLNVPPTNARWLGCSKEAATTNLALRAWRLVSAPSELKQPCPTVQTVPLIELLLPDRDPDAQRMIEGKLVLFGADVVGGDVYPTPINDMLPGVYIHAMAVKNLLAFGDRYLRETVNAWPLPVHVSWFFEATLIALVVLWLGGSRRGHAHDVPLIDKILKMLLHDGKLGLVTMALALILSAILMALLSLVPLNWLSVGALAALTREIIHWFPIDDWIIRRLGGFRGAAKAKDTIESARS